MLLKVTCKKCNENFKLDVGNKTIDQVKEQLKNQSSFECPGHHMEISSPINYWILGEIIPGEIQTEKEWLTDIKNRGIKLYSHDEINDLFVCGGFSYGLFCGHNKKTGEKVVFDFMRSPEGKRYYF